MGAGTGRRPPMKKAALKTDAVPNGTEKDFKAAFFHSLLLIEQ